MVLHARRRRGRGRSVVFSVRHSALDPGARTGRRRVPPRIRQRRLRRGQHVFAQRLDHIPPEVLAKNFGVQASAFANVPNPRQLYIFPAPVPGPLASDKIGGATEAPRRFSHRMMAQPPIKTKSGTVRITDSKVFPASTTIAAALVEVEPGAMRELHLHPNTDEWQYY